ncbi:MAG: transketolase [Deltaproteobacteria bacterium]|jgi:transketolase|nr:transketolase [Deltaproteobacteria bacterium]
MFKSILSSKAYTLRKMILNSVFNSSTGHVATSLSCAEILTVLYMGGVLRYDASNAEWEERDRFLLSKGHAATGFYCTLAMAGFISDEIALNVSSKNSSVGVHLQSNIPGVEFTSGSLGQGLGLGCGVALAARMDRRNYLTFVLTGDGECNEGSIWEAALFAGHHKLNNLIWIIDRNYMQCSDFTENCLSLESLKEKITSFNFNVKICDGNNCNSILEALKDVRSRVSTSPLCIIAETVKGRGIPSVENDLFAHHYIPAKDKIKDIIENYFEPFI